MNTVITAMDEVLARCQQSGKPLAVILAGHNGSGKSTLWYRYLSDNVRILLINADRVMLSILPAPDEKQNCRSGPSDCATKIPNGCGSPSRA